ncbi:hypothetical protein LOK49_LG01G00900, partial [Camellia lanceoleosa]
IQLSNASQETQRRRNGSVKKVGPQMQRFQACTAAQKKVWLCFGGLLSLKEMKINQRYAIMGSFILEFYYKLITGNTKNLKIWKNISYFRRKTPSDM